jgi:hypothetical protein
MKQENLLKLNDTFDFTVLIGGHGNLNLGSWAVVVGSTPPKIRSANVGKLNMFG